MREFFGWTKNSDTPSVYVHLSGRDLDEALLQHYGIKRDKSKKDESLKPTKCPRCESDSPPGSLYCSGYGMPLSDEAALQVEEKRRRADKIQEMFNEWMINKREELFREFMQQPEVKEEFGKLMSGGGDR